MYTRLEYHAGDRFFPAGKPKEKFSVLHNNYQNAVVGVTSRILGFTGFSPFVRRRYSPLVSSTASFGVRGQESRPFSKRLDPVRTSSAEKKQDILFKRIQMILAFYNLCKTFDPAAKVCIATGNEDLCYISRLIQHWTVPS